MRRLNGHDAFDALVQLLANADQSPWEASEPAFDRLRIALTSDQGQTSLLDLALLLRQALRYEYSRRGHEVSPRVLVANERFRDFSDWQLVGLAAKAEGGSRTRHQC